MYQLCRHIMPNGTRCHSPALLGTPYCYFHTRLHCFAAEKSHGGEEPIKISVLEDRSAIQIALAQVLNGLASSKLDPRRAGLFLYGLQIASQNVERKRTSSQSQRSLPSPTLAKAKSSRRKKASVNLRRIAPPATIVTLARLPSTKARTTERE